MLISILFVGIIIVYGFIGLKKGGIKSIGGLISMILSFILQPQRPEGKRELGTAHVGPKAQDHCVVSELPQAAASGESLD